MRRARPGGRAVLLFYSPMVSEGVGGYIGRVHLVGPAEEAWSKEEYGVRAELVSQPDFPDEFNFLDGIFDHSSESPRSFDI